jgi:hypothetical protein
VIVPGSQLLQAVLEEEYLPAAQSVHSSFPKPGCTFPSSQLTHVPWPVEGFTLPAGQFEH